MRILSGSMIGQAQSRLILLLLVFLACSFPEFGGHTRYLVSAESAEEGEGGENWQEEEEEEEEEYDDAPFYYYVGDGNCNNGVNIKSLQFETLEYNAAPAYYVNEYGQTVQCDDDSSYEWDEDGNYNENYNEECAAQVSSTCGDNCVAMGYKQRIAVTAKFTNSGTSAMSDYYMAKVKVCNKFRSCGFLTYGKKVANVCYDNNDNEDGSSYGSSSTCNLYNEYQLPSYTDTFIANHQGASELDLQLTLSPFGSQGRYSIYCKIPLYSGDYLQYSKNKYYYNTYVSGFGGVVGVLLVVIMGSFATVIVRRRRRVVAAIDTRSLNPDDQGIESNFVGA